MKVYVGMTESLFKSRFNYICYAAIHVELFLFRKISKREVQLLWLDRLTGNQKLGCGFESRSGTLKFSEKK